MPEASRSFHYWQPAPRWRLLPWLANPGNSAMSPYAGRGTGTRHTVETVERGRERGWEENCLGDELPHSETRGNASCTYATLRYATIHKQVEFRLMRICPPGERKRSLMLTPLNYIWLHINFNEVYINFVSMLLICQVTYNKPDADWFMKGGLDEPEGDVSMEENDGNTFFFQKWWEMAVCFSDFNLAFCLKLS